MIRRLEIVSDTHDHCAGHVGLGLLLTVMVAILALMSRRFVSVPNTALPTCLVRFVVVEVWVKGTMFDSY